MSIEPLITVYRYEAEIGKAKRREEAAVRAATGIPGASVVFLPFLLISFSFSSFLLSIVHLSVFSFKACKKGRREKGGGLLLGNRSSTTERKIVG